MVQELPPIDPAILHARRERVFLVLAGLFLGTLAMLNILGISRFLVIASWGLENGSTVLVWGRVLEDKYAWSFLLAVGVLPYPVTFLCTDLISEFYGRRRANAVVFVGFLLNLWVAFILWLGGVLPPVAELDPISQMPSKDSYDWAFWKIRALTFGSVAASMIAYLTAQFCDVYLFHFWKRMTRGRHLWLRNNGSTLISQLIDTVAVILITHFYAHALPPSPEGRTIALHLALFIVTGYVFKLLTALADTPIIYLAVRLLSRYLYINPFAEQAGANKKVRLFSDDGEAPMD